MIRYIYVCVKLYAYNGLFERGLTNMYYNENKINKDDIIIVLFMTRLQILFICNYVGNWRSLNANIKLKEYNRLNWPSSHAAMVLLIRAAGGENQNDINYVCCFYYLVTIGSKAIKTLLSVC